MKLNYVVCPTAREDPTTDNADCLSRVVTIELAAYDSYVNEEEPDDQNSGAYIFRPVEQEAKAYWNTMDVEAYQGEGFIEIMVLRSEVASLYISLP